MNKTSAKSAARSLKSAPRNGKKAVKALARPSAKKTTKSVRELAARIAARKAAKRTSMKLATASSIISTMSPPVQPLSQIEISHAHKYQVGETVYFTSPTFGRAAATGSYTVVKQLPSEGDDYQYRIKSNGEAFERVAKESQLDRA
jgi:hypothetical protein